MMYTNMIAVIVNWVFPERMTTKTTFSTEEWKQNQKEDLRRMGHPIKIILSDYIFSGINL